MSGISRYVLGVGAVLLALSACNKKDGAGADAGGDGSVAIAPATPPSGRCKVSTPDTAYDALFFYPEKKEFLTRIEGGVAVEPLTVTTSAAGKVEFTTKPWRDPDKQNAPTTQTGTLTFTGPKWSFHFERHNDADCAPDNFDLTYKPLPEIGIKAGTWSSKEGLSMTFLADGQRFLQKYKKEEKVVYYRVLDKTDAGIVIGTSATPPSSASGDIWLTSTLTPVGDKLNVSMKDLQLMLSYSGPAAGSTASSSPVAAPATRGEPANAIPKAAERRPAVDPAAKACCDAMTALTQESPSSKVQNASGGCKALADGTASALTVKEYVQRKLGCPNPAGDCTPVTVPPACR